MTGVDAESVLGVLEGVWRGLEGSRGVPELAEGGLLGDGGGRETLRGIKLQTARSCTASEVSSRRSGPRPG